MEWFSCHVYANQQLKLDILLSFQMSIPLSLYLYHSPSLSLPEDLKILDYSSGDEKTRWENGKQFRFETDDDSRNKHSQKGPYPSPPQKLEQPDNNNSAPIMSVEKERENGWWVVGGGAMVAMCRWKRCKDKESSRRSWWHLRRKDTTTTTTTRLSRRICKTWEWTFINWPKSSRKKRAT